MIEYGRMKRKSYKAHPHNECSVCSECSVSKGRERQRAKEQIQAEIVNVLPETAKLCDHDYEHPVRKGRAHYVCPKCGEDITMELFFIHEAEKGGK